MHLGPLHRCLWMRSGPIQRLDGRSSPKLELELEVEVEAEAEVEDQAEEGEGAKGGDGS